MHRTAAKEVLVTMGDYSKTPLGPLGPYSVWVICGAAYGLRLTSSYRGCGLGIEPSSRPYLELARASGSGLWHGHPGHRTGEGKGTHRELE